jgi:hypothetical protein
MAISSRAHAWAFLVELVYCMRVGSGMSTGSMPVLTSVT